VVASAIAAGISMLSTERASADVEPSATR
jgi:hypothetical protein